MKTYYSVLLFLTGFIFIQCKPLVDYQCEDHYVFINQTSHAFTLSSYTIHEWNEATTELKPGHDTTFVEVYPNTGKRPKGFNPIPLPMVRDSLIVQFDDGKKLVFKPDSTGYSKEYRSVYNPDNYENTVTGGRYLCKYTFDEQDYERAK